MTNCALFLIAMALIFKASEKVIEEDCYIPAILILSCLFLAVVSLFIDMYWFIQFLQGN